MAFTVIDWNVNGFALKGQVGFLEMRAWDIALLQEVTREAWPEFRRLGSGGGVAFDHLPALLGAGPRYASAVLVRDSASLVEFNVLREVPSPERAAVADIEIDGHQLTACSWAAPPGASWGKAGKGRQVIRYAAWLAARSRPVVVGIDRNAPKWERLALEDDEWWNDDEPVLYGPDRAHDLRDIFRELVERDADLRTAISAAHPDGPLAVTHRRRGAGCRYDAIYASPEIQVLSVTHDWDEARQAGSDHAAVTAILDVRSPR